FGIRTSITTTGYELLNAIGVAWTHGGEKPLGDFCNEVTKTKHHENRFRPLGH
ncbi:hypothetical protein CHS0354_032806, partial [Potamilus streckersoni]